MKFIKVTARHCDLNGKLIPQNPEQKKFRINVELIVAIDEVNSRIFTHDKAIKVNGEYYTDLMINQALNLDSL